MGGFLLTFGLDDSLLWGHDVHPRMSGSIPCLCRLDASSTSLATKSDNQECLQILTHVLQG
jgi:hypothetical protein